MKHQNRMLLLNFSARQCTQLSIFQFKEQNACKVISLLTFSGDSLNHHMQIQPYPKTYITYCLAVEDENQPCVLRKDFSGNKVPSSYFQSDSKSLMGSQEDS